jgi:hypothetical protein
VTATAGPSTTILDVASSKETFGPGTLSGLGTFGPGTLAGPPPLPRWIVPGDCGCGCNPQCIYFEDHFDREDSGNVGDDYKAHAGSFTIDDHYVTTTSPNALLQCMVEGEEDAHVVSALLKGSAVGDQVRLISSYLRADSYWFVELECGTFSSTLKVFERGPEGNTQRGTTFTLTYYGLVDRFVMVEIRFGSGGICVYAGGPDNMQEVLVYQTAALTDSWCGFGTGTLNGTATFGDLLLKHHKQFKSKCPGCVFCPHTVDNQMPSCLRLDFGGFTLNEGCSDYHCSCLNQSVYLPWDRPCEWSTDLYAWWGCMNYATYFASLSSAFNLHVSVYRGRPMYGTTVAMFDKTFGGPPDVMSFASEGLPLTYADPTSKCDASAATVTVTADHGGRCVNVSGCHACSGCGSPATPDEVQIVFDGFGPGWEDQPPGWFFNIEDGRTYVLRNIGKNPPPGVARPAAGCTWRVAFGSPPWNWNFGYVQGIEFTIGSGVSNDWKVTSSVNIYRSGWGEAWHYLTKDWGSESVSCSFSGAEHSQTELLPPYYTWTASVTMG